MHSECSVLSAQCNSSALTVCVFLFNVTHNTVIVLLVSSLLFLLSIILRSACRRPVRLIVRLMRLFIVEFRVSIDNFLECRARPPSAKVCPEFHRQLFSQFFWGTKVFVPAHGRAAGPGSDFNVTGRSTRRRGPRSSGITAWDHTRCSHSALSACKVSGTEC